MTIGKLGKLELISTNLRSTDNNLFFHPLSLFSNTTTEIIFRAGQIGFLGPAIVPGPTFVAVEKWGYLLHTAIFFLNVTTSSISNCIYNSQKFPLQVELFPLCESSFSWRNSLVFMAPASQQECDRGNLLVWEQDDGSSEPRGTPDELKYPLSNGRQQYTWTTITFCVVYNGVFYYINVNN